MGAQEERGAAQLPAQDCEVREYQEVLSPNTQPRYDHLHSWSRAVQVVPLQKVLQQEGGRCQCILYIFFSTGGEAGSCWRDCKGRDRSHTVEEKQTLQNTSWMLVNSNYLFIEMNTLYC